MTSIKGPKLAKFAAGSTNNTWLQGNGMKVYVRNTNRFMQGMGHVRSLDIANVINQRKGTGMFTKWLAYAERIARAAGHDIVFVENLLNDRLAEFLARSGYEVHNGAWGGPPSYYKTLQPLKD